MFFLCHKIGNDRTRHVSLGLTQIFENSARSVCGGGGGDDNMNFKAQRVFLSLFQPAPQLLP